MELKKYLNRYPLSTLRYSEKNDDVERRCFCLSLFVPERLWDQVLKQLTHCQNLRIISRDCNLETRMILYLSAWISEGHEK